MYQYTATAPTIQIILCPFVNVNESTNFLTLLYNNGYWNIFVILKKQLSVE